MRGDGVGRDLGLEVTGSNGGAGLLVRSDGEGILLVARHFPLLGNLLGGEAHAEGDGVVVVALKEGRVDGDLVAHHLVHQRHRFGAGSDHHVGFAEADARGSIGHGLHAGGAEAIDSVARHRIRQSGQQHADAGDVHALLGFRHGAADDDVVDQRRIKPRGLRQNRLDGMGQHVVRTDVAEHALALGHRQTRGGNDVGVLNLFLHNVLQILNHQGTKITRQAPRFSL